MNADLQARINDLIRYNQVQAVRNENRKHGTRTKGWWNTVNKITGRESKALNISSVISPDDINLFFQRINTDTQYTVPELLPIPEGTRVLSLDLLTVRTFMTRLKPTAPGPDGFLYWLWRDLHTILLQLSISFLTLHSDSRQFLFHESLATYHQFPKNLHCYRVLSYDRYPSRTLS